MPPLITSHPMRQLPIHHPHRWVLVSLGAAVLLAACATSPPTAPVVSVTPQPVATAAIPPPSLPPSIKPVGKRSGASSAMDYRRDAAAHLYELNAHRIYRGKMQPLLYAIGVLDVDLDSHGNVKALSWRRAPNHAPEVIAEIERTVRQAAPYPTPARLGSVTYTDIWLWDKSGQFQLDTLTEGQL